LFAKNQCQATFTPNIRAVGKLADKSAPKWCVSLDVMLNVESFVKTNDLLRTVHPSTRADERTHDQSSPSNSNDKRNNNNDNENAFRKTSCRNPFEDPAGDDNDETRHCQTNRLQKNASQPDHYEEAAATVVERVDSPIHDLTVKNSNDKVNQWFDKHYTRETGDGESCSCPWLR